MLIDRFAESSSLAALGSHPLDADADALLRWALRRVASHLPQFARTVRTAGGLKRAVGEAVRDLRPVVALRDVPRRGGALEAAAAEAVGGLMVAALSRGNPALALRLPAVADIGPYTHPFSGRTSARCIFAAVLDMGAVAAGVATPASAWSTLTPLCSPEDVDTAQITRDIAALRAPAAAMVALRRAWFKASSAAAAALQPRRALRALIRRGWTPLGVGAACIALEGALLRLQPVRAVACGSRTRVFTLFGTGAAIAVAAVAETAAQGARMRGRRHAPTGTRSSEELAVGAIAVLVAHTTLCAFALHQHASEVFAAADLARGPAGRDPEAEYHRRRAQLDEVAPCREWGHTPGTGCEACAICLSQLDAPGPAPQPQPPPSEALPAAGVQSWVRRLPCSHLFHAACVESWLLERGRGSCPLCMHEVIAPEAESEDEAEERRPLVGWPPHRHAPNGNVPAPWHL